MSKKRRTKREKVIAELRRLQKKQIIEVVGETRIPIVPLTQEKVIPKASVNIEILQKDYSYILVDFRHTVIITSFLLTANILLFFLMNLK